MAAPKGNEYWKLASQYGQKGWFETSEDLEKAINEYFQTGVKTRQVEVGKEGNKTVIEIPVPTITGLCFFIGFASRQSFYDYEKKEAFTYIVKRARLFIEQEYEEHLSFGNVTGAIFALKQMGWTDQQDIKITDDSKINTDEETLRRLAFMLRNKEEEESSGAAGV